MTQENNINIFEQLLYQKITLFINHFKEASTGLFYDETKKRLIHPGEYGVYREKICKEFLKNFTPLKYNFGTGFIINSNNEVSTQCDIIIYDPQLTPLIQGSELQTFYPIECVVAVGEIKSALKKTEFTEALKKLAKIKKMREKIKEPVISYSRPPDNRIYDPKNCHSDQIFTFLICEKLDFKYEKLVDEFNTIYDAKENDLTHKHNLILSIDNGLICYEDDVNCKWMMYPVHGRKHLKNCILTDTTGKNEYFKLFASYFSIGVSGTTTLIPEITHYMGSVRGLTDIKESS